jgi:imidazolonepropionase-like amidohydrolase
VAVTALLAPAVLWAQTPPAHAPLAFTNVTVIDGTGAPPRRHVSVLVAEGRIVKIGPIRTTALPADAHVIDGSGKVLIPGLWDMHVHLAGQGDGTPAAFIALGVTGVRDMGGNLAVIQRWRRRIRNGTVLGPRIVAPGPILDGPQARGTSGRRAVTSAAEGVEAVRELKAEGVDFIKTHSLLPRDAYFAIAGEAQRQGLAVAGHVPDAVRLDEAIAAGHRTIEHLVGVSLACSTRETALRARLRDDEQGLDRQPADIRAYVDARLRIDGDATQSYSPARAATVFARLAQQQVWQCPTLVKWRADERAWLFARKLALVRAMHRAGVPFLAGTDLGAYRLRGGTSLHDELELLVQAGLTPMQALQTATRNPARVLGLEHELGTVEEGKLADLVLLEADPLRAIRNTRKIWAVVVNGRLVDRAALDSLAPAAAEDGLSKTEKKMGNRKQETGSSYSGSARVRTSTSSENHENTKERKQEKAGIPEIKNRRMKTST